MKYVVLGFAAACLLVSGSAFANEELVKKNNCLGCHQIDKKAMGPGFKEVAAKYKTDKEGAKKIETSILKGSTGNWGTTMPMPPQAGVSEADAKTLATWILSLAAEEKK